MKKYISNFLIIAFLAVFCYSCQSDYVSDLKLDGKVTINSFSVNGKEGVINESSKTIKVIVPDGTDLTKMSPVINLPEGATISPEITTNMDFSTPIEFTIVNGSIYSKYTISITEQFYIAFLGEAPTAATITEDDQKAAADWFFANYENAEYVSFAAIKAGTVDLTKYRLLWWYYDVSRTLPAIAKDATVLNAINNYYKGGRNLLLNSQACGYLWNLGRMEGNYPMAIGDGDGFENGDTWGVGANIGSHNMTGHPIYKGISFNVDNDGYNWVPVIGPGWREDHNHAILEIAREFNLPNNSEDAYVAFTTRHNVKWLGVWAGIRDYFMAGVLEYLPTTTYKGKAIYMGIGGIEFNQNKLGTINPGGVNVYQSNINKMIKNSIDYLSLKN